MGWSIGYDTNWNRDIGYGVPAICDQPECHEKIDRGLAYVCGSEPFGGEHGCGLYFCPEHLVLTSIRRLGTPDEGVSAQLCARCRYGRRGIPFEPKPDVPEWTDFKMTDPSWAQWRAESGIQ